MRDNQELVKSMPVPEFVDEYLDKHKQKIIKDFKQNHLIAAYFQLDDEKKQRLLSKMETIQFDLLDLVDVRADW